VLAERHPPTSAYVSGFERDLPDVGEAGARIVTPDRRHAAEDGRV